MYGLEFLDEEEIENFEKFSKVKKTKMREGQRRDKNGGHRQETLKDVIMENASKKLPEANDDFDE